ncbi:MAG: hypothetical protein LBK66_15245 [Spirochaetaceae bacterium]|jgi:hypothetical protein|nr:hypothetical protein [Spirochaetaceae bacterium]
MWKKSSICAAAAAIALAFGLLLAGCDHNSRYHYTEPVDNPAITDDPSEGIMTLDTAYKIFYKDGVSFINNKAIIKKFMNATALREYLEVGTVPPPSSSVTGGVSKSVNMAVGGPSYDETPDASGYEFNLNSIGGLPITEIESNAFKPDPALGGTDDISSVVKTVVLPDTITSLGENVFEAVGAEIEVDIPPAVVTAVTGQSVSAGSSASSSLQKALEKILGGDVAVAVKPPKTPENPTPAPVIEPIPPVNPSLESVTPSWNGDTLTVTLKYSKPVDSVTLASGYSDSWNNFTSSGGGITWTSTYKGSTNTDTWYVPIRAATSYNGGSKTATKDVSLVNGDLTRPTGDAVTYKIIGYLNGPDGTKVAGLAKETASTTGENGASTYADTVWKTIPTGEIRNIFEAIYVPNAPGTKDGFVAGETDKTAITFTSDISKAALQLFHVTLGSNSNGDGIKIQGTALPTADGANNKNLIIIDVGQPGNVDNSGLPVFRIPDRRLGTQNVEYDRIRLRVNKGAQLVIEADNSNYINNTSGKTCPTGYLNGGCVEAMAGGKLRDGAYEGFPLGQNAVILNRNASYLAIGPEAGTTADYGQWYAGWLIGPDSGSPRIVWTGGNESNYIEVRPKELAIDANVTVQKSMGLIYSVFFLNNTVVTIDTTANDNPSIYDNAGSSAVYGPGGSVTVSSTNGSISVTGLAVNARPGENGLITNDTNYKFYAQSEGVSIILKATNTKESSIHAYPLIGTQGIIYAAQFITAGSATTGQSEHVVTITGTKATAPTDYVNNSTGIVGYNSWALKGKILNTDNIFTE